MPRSFSRFRFISFRQRYMIWFSKKEAPRKEDYIQKISGDYWWWRFSRLLMIAVSHFLARYIIWLLLLGFTLPFIYFQLPADISFMIERWLPMRWWYWRAASRYRFNASAAHHSCPTFRHFIWIHAREVSSTILIEREHFRHLSRYSLLAKLPYASTFIAAPRMGAYARIYDFMLYYYWNNT